MKIYRGSHLKLQKVTFSKSHNYSVCCNLSFFHFELKMFFFFGIDLELLLHYVFLLQLPFAEIIAYGKFITFTKVTT